MHGLEKTIAAGPELRPRSARGRSLWKTLRRRWKEFASDRPEDELLLGLRRSESSRTALEWTMLAFLTLAPVVGLLMDPASALARVGLLLATAAGILAATQLDRDRGRSALVLPLTSALLGTGFATLLALGVLGLARLPMGSSAWMAFALFPVLTAATALREDGRLCALTAVLSGAAWLVLMRHGPSTPGAGAEAGAVAAQLLVIAVVGALAAVAARRGRVLRRAALLHPGTGLMNRDAFEACVSREVSRAQRSGRPLSIGRIQLEAFAELVGRHGRPLADAVERYVSMALRDRCRTTDGVAHLEDGSFAIAFLDSGHPRLRERLECLCLLLRDFEVTGSADPAPVQLSVRAGLAVFPRDGRDAPAVLHASERALRLHPAGAQA